MVCGAKGNWQGVKGKGGWIYCDREDILGGGHMMQYTDDLS